MSLRVPIGIRNAPTQLMQELGYGSEYRYNPDYKHPVRARQEVPYEKANPIA
jgi:putative ATPase